MQLKLPPDNKRRNRRWKDGKMKIKMERRWEAKQDKKNKIKKKREWNGMRMSDEGDEKKCNEKQTNERGQRKVGRTKSYEK